jgi:hypothetical protein
MKRSLLCRLLFGLLAVPATAAATEVSALGSSGIVYVARTGAESQLIPGSQGQQPVLVLEVRSRGAEPLRLVVPRTAGTEIESAPNLVVDPGSETVFLIWQSQSDGPSATLMLTSFAGEAWGEVLEIRDNPLSAKGFPQVWVTRDAYTISETGREVGRAVIHVIWWEESPLGDLTYYKPLVLIDGAYDGSHSAVLLNELDGGEPELLAPAAATALSRAPRLQTGRSDHAVLVTFANPLTSRLVVIESSVLPGELGILADAVRDHVIAAGAQFPDLTSLADVVRGHIIGTGARIHPGVLTFLGDVVRGHIIGTGARYADDRHALAASASQVIINEGARMLEDGVGQARPAAAPVLSTRAAASDPRAAPSNLLRLRLLSARPVPPAAEAATTLHASADGRTVLVSWRFPQQIRYRESLAREWSALLRLDLGAQLSPEEAARILERRVGR